MKIFKCSICGKVTSGCIPKNGDRTLRYPRKHLNKNILCDGCYIEAIWLDKKGRET